jgi:hypothetical protein
MRPKTIQSKNNINFEKGRHLITKKQKQKQKRFDITK